MKRWAVLSLVLVPLCVPGYAGDGFASTASVTPSVVRAADRDNGRTIRLQRGQRLVVVLASTYWQVQGSSNSTVLRLVGRPKISPKPGCVPGAGCGTVTATYLAAAVGRGAVTATRTSCGEAMGCTPAQSRFTLNLVVR